MTDQTPQDPQKSQPDQTKEPSPRRQVEPPTGKYIISCPEAIEFESEPVPRQSLPQRDPKTGRFTPGPSVQLPLREKQVRTERSLKIAIADWVSFCLLGWKLPNGNIPSIPIWLDWTRDERLKPWTDLELEVDCSTFSGNYSELAFSYPFKDLKRLYQAGKPFKIPPKQFTPCPQYLFSLQGLPGQISYLPGCLYSRELPEADLNASFTHDPFERRKHTLRCLLVLPDLASSPHALVRITDRSGHLDRAISEQHPALESVLNRSDVLRSHSVTERHDEHLETELYLELDLSETRLRGYFHEQNPRTAKKQG